MAIKWILTKGIGFSPASVKYVPTHGFISGTSARSKFLWDRVHSLVSGGPRTSSSAGFLDYVIPGSTVTVEWTTNDTGNGSITATVPASGVKVYKNSSATESTTGVTTTVDFDSLTGVHVTTIDTSQDTTFYELGAIYHVVLVGATINTRTVNNVLSSFTLGELVS